MTEDAINILSQLSRSAIIYQEYERDQRLKDFSLNLHEKL